jgi:hypothetical protein
MRRLGPLLFAAFGAAVSVGCKDTVSPRPATENVVPLEGLGQTAERLDTLPQRLVVRVVDDERRPVARAPVTWSISDSDGRFASLDSTTDGDGRARATVILGFVPGVQTIEVRALGFDDVARFTATATSAPGFKALSLMRRSSETHMCAIDAEHRAWCWGSNDYGQLGNGSLEPSTRPQAVTTTERFTHVWGRWGTTCGLTLAGKLFCWGENGGLGGSSAIFGNGTRQPSRVPVPAGGGMSFRAFDMASSAACGVTAAGEGFCWGAGALGDGAASTESATPVPISGGAVWREIITDDSRGCALSEARRVHCWASFDPWQEIGVDAVEAFVPTEVRLFADVTGLSIGWYNQCGMQASRGAVCWGSWVYGSLLPAPGPEYPRPRGEEFERILASNESIMGRSASGQLWIWGEPPGGYDGWISDSPVALKPAGPWLEFAVGDGAFAILASDSTVWRWPVEAFGGFYEIERGSLLPEPVPAP